MPGDGLTSGRRRGRGGTATRETGAVRFLNTGVPKQDLPRLRRERAALRREAEPMEPAFAPGRIEAKHLREGIGNFGDCVRCHAGGRQHGEGEGGEHEGRRRGGEREHDD